MRSNRDEFPAHIKVDRFTLAKGRCELCRKLIVSVAHYDHFPVPAALGGPGTFENCRCLCRLCHERVTREHDQPAIAKSKRIVETRMGLRAKKAPFPKRRDPWGKERRG
jgi:hypothetical protein